MSSAIYKETEASSLQRKCPEALPVLGDPMPSSGSAGTKHARTHKHTCRHNINVIKLIKIKNIKTDNSPYKKGYWGWKDTQ